MKCGKCKKRKAKCPCRREPGYVRHLLGYPLYDDDPLAEAPGAISIGGGPPIAVTSWTVIEYDELIDGTLAPAREVHSDRPAEAIAPDRN